MVSGMTTWGEITVKDTLMQRAGQDTLGKTEHRTNITDRCCSAQKYDRLYERHREEKKKKKKLLENGEREQK